MKTLMFLVGAGLASAWMILNMRNKATNMLSMADNSEAGKMQSSAVQRQGDMDTHSSADKGGKRFTKESATGNVD